VLHTFHALNGIEAPLRHITAQVVRPVPRQHRPFWHLVPRPASYARYALLPRKLLLAHLLVVVLIVDLGQAELDLDLRPYRTRNRTRTRGPLCG